MIDNKNAVKNTHIKVKSSNDDKKKSCHHEMKEMRNQEKEFERFDIFHQGIAHEKHLV